jgi:hypothetical protein
MSAVFKEWITTLIILNNTLYRLNFMTHIHWEAKLDRGISQKFLSQKII